ncbi:sugar phosphate isomerase/epimerase family protein [Paludisphaera mucosa]|uniref:Sugar phosphate isomerase/epimerase n=1 Tax=Paludisphaera mucosa TaxID=3030827 RepID=A0ABT6F3T1_9BACT|nr:sugar phosphate isomerase/epimerase [Paludisphaera mucosa]MDG3002232.1 sugar phosphate isomerase/epimerase [Paludisphaera mucosa]
MSCVPDDLDRRAWLRAAGAGLATLAAAPRAGAARRDEPHGEPTRFRIACMTLPYARFPLGRALTGVKAAGYEYVAWGVTHDEGNGEPTPVLAAEAPPARAKELGDRCRDLGLVPVMMFSGIYPEAPKSVEVFTSRIRQAAAAGIPQVLTFGHTAGGDRKLWVERFKALGPIARDHEVTIVVKQHGGETGTGTACAQIVREVADDGVKVNYDAGNVMDYLDVDPIADLKACAGEVRSFCIKDHRNFPRDEDCGPGFGEIDHYKLLHAVAFTGGAMPLCCENISAPLLPPPTRPEEVDALARRAREFLEVVIRGLTSL